MFNYARSQAADTNKQRPMAPNPMAQAAIEAAMARAVRITQLRLLLIAI